MLPRILGWAIVLGTAAVATVLVWPQAFGLQNQWVAAHVVALRGAAAAVAVAALVPFLLLSLVRRVRLFAFAMAAVFALFAVGNVAVLGVRGFGSGAGGETVAEASDSVTVLSWNTLGEVPDASAIAGLALEQGADVVVLPETTEPLGEEVAVEMREGGRPMWVHTLAYDLVAKARSTTILISPELGDYDVVSPEAPGPPGNTNTLPSVVADPVDGEGPRIVAVHAVAPIRWELRNWRSDLDWLAEQCAGENVIMAGDFNATVDHFAGHGIDGGDLGRCMDAAVQGGAGGVSTWPTDVPPLLGSPIDHVLATPGWSVEAFRVLLDYDDAGSDHRPIVTTLTRTG
jgi:endonuclease/exonuclease/phosphatase (EEP) superfamily protein YafD